MFRRKPKNTPNNPITPTERETVKDFAKYKQSAADWEDDKYRRQRALSFMMWALCCFLTIAVVALAFAIGRLAPLKTVEPYLIRVDSSTGIAETLSKNDLANVKWSQSERTAIDRYFLTKYVVAREGYNYPLRNDKYNTVAVMSSAPVAKTYQTYIGRDNPQSPINTLGRESVVDIEIKSISWPATDDGSVVAYVRFTRQVKSLVDSSRNYPVDHMLATINYRYIPDAEISNAVRQINPLGFVVSAYQITEEVQ